MSNALAAAGTGRWRCKVNYALYVRIIMPCNLKPAPDTFSLYCHNTLLYHMELLKFYLTGAK